MGKFRDEMRNGRAVLHQTMGDGAIIFAWPLQLDELGNTIPPDVFVIKVRVHEYFKAQGDLKGTNYHYSELEDGAPVAVFWLEEISPARGMVFVTEYGRAYRVDTTFPKDDQTQNAKVIELLARDMVGMPEYQDYV